MRPEVGILKLISIVAEPKQASHAGEARLRASGVRLRNCESGTVPRTCRYTVPRARLRRHFDGFCSPTALPARRVQQAGTVATIWVAGFGAEVLSPPAIAQGTEDEVAHEDRGPAVADHPPSQGTRDAVPVSYVARSTSGTAAAMERHEGRI